MWRGCFPAPISRPCSRPSNWTRRPFDEVSSSGDNASVQLGGSLTFSFDAEQLRGLLRALAEQSGQPVDEATVDALVAGLQSAGQSIPISETVDVVREGGSWKICSRLTLMP